MRFPCPMGNDGVSVTDIFLGSGNSVLLLYTAHCSYTDIFPIWYLHTYPLGAHATNFPFVKLFIFKYFHDFSLSSYSPLHHADLAKIRACLHPTEKDKFSNLWVTVSDVLLPHFAADIDKATSKTLFLWLKKKTGKGWPAVETKPLLISLTNNLTSSSVHGSSYLHPFILSGHSYTVKNLVKKII